jgi:ATP-binding protein involved in chromosome partitioning
LAQKVPVTGAVIVTTPQDIALLDAQKGIAMFQKVNIPVLGIVENMAVHICSQCGHAEHIFGENGGSKLAQDFDVALLGQLPLSLDIRLQMDQGNPPVSQDQNSAAAQLYIDMAKNTLAAIEALDDQSGPDISFS